MNSKSVQSGKNQDGSKAKIQDGDNQVNYRITKIKSVIAIMALLASAQLTFAQGQYFGAIYTTKGDGTKVNQNLYDHKSDVYLNGGPQNESSQGLPDGTYYYQVTDPSGSTLLSTDNAECRQALVSNGIISGSTGPACKHADGIANASNGGSIPVQLIPFADTPNTGGEYKVWLIRQVSTTTIDPLNRTVIHFKNNDVKTDNFKVNEFFPSLSILTEVDVTGLTAAGQVNPAIPVVTWQNGSYKVNHSAISGVTGTPGWSVTVQDRAFVNVNGAKPQGTVSFSLYNNDQCIPDANNPEWPKSFGSSSTWTAEGNGVYSSGPSLPFTFTQGGMWGFQARYVGSDYGNVTDLGCEAWPIPKVNTAIYADGVQTPVTVGANGGSVQAGTNVYDRAFVDTQDSSLNGVIPSGSTIQFLFYKNISCSEPLFQTQSPALGQDLVSGFQTGSANSPTTGAVPSYMSYRAIFVSGNPNLVPNVADNVCEPLTVVQALGVSKTVAPSLKRTYNWSISKTVDSALKEAPGSSTFNYTVTVSQAGKPVDSEWKLTGNITVSNPNPWSVNLSSVPTDLSGNGGSCSAAAGNLSIAANQSSVFAYTCTFASAPTFYVGTNTASVSYTDHSLSISAAGTAAYDFGSGAVTSVNDTINVTDTFANSLGIAGPATNTEPYTFIKTFTYPRTVSPAPAACVTVPNTATIVETNQSASASATACNTKTGALTIGYWQNKNGQTIISGGLSTAGVCNSGTWLRQFAPFQDLSATATCKQVADYVTTVIKAASAAGAAMNPMLKGQMLATALDVYFSDAALGGNKINAVGPIGAVKINLTIIPEAPGSLSTEDARPAFGGTSPQTVLSLLSAAAGNSNSGGITWYGNVKTTQELAKDTFDAINNEVAPIVP